MIALLISLSQEVELWEACCYGLLDTLVHLINIGTNVNMATMASASFCTYRLCRCRSTLLLPSGCSSFSSIS